MINEYPLTLQRANQIAKELNKKKANPVARVVGSNGSHFVEVRRGVKAGRNKERKIDATVIEMIGRKT